MSTYEVYVVKYAESMPPHGTRFYGHDPHDAPTPMDFFVWVATSLEHTVVVDCGFTAATAARRGRIFHRTPADGLALLGIASDTVRHVVLTHFHNDHIGNVADFLAATFVVQDREMAFWTGRYASKEGTAAS
jgi:glyoxylase-like metal-dependent hydrolase (beta-lactamase superfamily II)